jgi:hypothetical protein
LFSFEPTITKDNWSILSHHHATEAGVNFNSAYYSLTDGKPLLHQQVVSKAEQNGGYVIYIPSDALIHECKQEAEQMLLGMDQQLTGNMLSQILLQRDMGRISSAFHQDQLPSKSISSH